VLNLSLKGIRAVLSLNPIKFAPLDASKMLKLSYHWNACEAREEDAAGVYGYTDTL
jgi:hypothetical protein